MMDYHKIYSNTKTAVDKIKALEIECARLASLTSSDNYIHRSQSQIFKDGEKRAVLLKELEQSKAKNLALKNELSDCNLIKNELHENIKKHQATINDYDRTNANLIDDVIGLNNEIDELKNECNRHILKIGELEHISIGSSHFCTAEEQPQYSDNALEIANDRIKELESELNEAECKLTRSEIRHDSDYQELAKVKSDNKELLKYRSAYAECLGTIAMVRLAVNND